jgi:hypothetical protein
MVFEELLAEFRALGGVAENVRLGRGRSGRGIFVVDPGKPAALLAPENALVPADGLEVRDGQLTVKATAEIGVREREFFNACHRSFGWGAGLFEEIWEAQAAWSELPADVARFITNMGGTTDPHMRFLAPSDDVCFYHFVKSRDFLHADRLYLAPLIDLVNHAGGAPTYDLHDGIGVSGTFQDEMLVRYNDCDSWAFAMVYGFAERAAQAYSLGITVDLFGRKKLAIDRDVAIGDWRGGVRFPRAIDDGSTVRVSHLLLGHAEIPDLPRALFRELVRPYLHVSQTDEVFDSIARFNRAMFLNLLRTLRGRRGALISMLEESAIDQLDALSACVGAKTLQ